MANLNVKFKKILQELEDNIQNKEDLDYIKTQLFNLYNLFFDELSRIEETVSAKIETIAGTETLLNEKLNKLENSFKSMEKELYLEDDSDFTINCPYCNNEFIVDYDELRDEVQCPECNNIIELDWGDEEEQNGCSGCGHDCTKCNDEQDEEDM